MNQNAFNKKSNIKPRKIKEGFIPDNVGFPKTMSGYTMPSEEYLDTLIANGYSVEHTSKGIFIDPPIVVNN